MHNVARAGFDLSGASGLYDRARPSYPDEVIDQILRAPTSSLQAGSARPLVIAELGVGTGIASRCLLQRSCALAQQQQQPQSSSTPFPGLAALHGFEPSEGMRSSFRAAIVDELVPSLKQQGALHPEMQCTVSEGLFDKFAAQLAALEQQRQQQQQQQSAVSAQVSRQDDTAGTADLILIAQAWHWCPDFDAALAEMARALRPGGVLALLWNLEDRDAAHWVARARDTFEAHEGGAPQYRTGEWKAMYRAPSLAQHFDALPELHVQRVLPTTIQGVHERVLSKSYVSLLPPDQQKAVTKTIDDIFAEGDAKSGRKWMDEEKGVFEYPYRTDAFMFRRK